MLLLTFEANITDTCESVFISDATGGVVKTDPRLTDVGSYTTVISTPAKLTAADELSFFENAFSLQHQ